MNATQKSGSFDKNAGFPWGDKGGIEMADNSRRNEHYVSGDSNNVRFVVSGSSTEVLVYRSFEAVSERQVRKVRGVGWFTWTVWESEGDPLPIGVQFQNTVGNPITTPPVTRSGSGWQSIGHYGVGTVAGELTSMRVSYTFERQSFTFDIGRDWVRPVVIVVLVILIVVLGGGLLALLLA